MINCHIYEDQIPMMEELVSRKPFDPPELVWPSAVSLDTIHPDDFSVKNYNHHEKISIPFSV